MPDRGKDTQFRNSRSFEFKLKIRDLDYTSDIKRISILSSLGSVYPILTITLYLDPLDILLGNGDDPSKGGLYGQDPIRLETKVLTQTSEQQESLIFDLMYLGGGVVQIPIRPQLSDVQESNIGSQSQRVDFTITTVCRKPFKTMLSFVNSIEEGKDIQTIIKNLIDQIGTDTELVFDSEDSNTESLDQVIIPPSTLANAISYLEDTFGIHNGITSTYCQYNNTLQIKNLTKQFSKTPELVIYHVATDSEKTEKLQEKTLDGKHYISVGQITTDYIGNSKFAELSKNLKHIVKPKDKLYKIIEKDLEEIASDYGLIDQDNSMYIDENVSFRNRYYIEQTGYEDTEYFINSSISKQLSSLSFLRVNVGGNISIENLINVGNVIKLDTQTAEYISISGKYILHASELVFIRQTEFQATGALYLIRTNKTSS